MRCTEGIWMAIRVFNHSNEKENSFDNLNCKICGKTKEDKTCKCEICDKECFFNDKIYDLKII